MRKNQKKLIKNSSQSRKTIQETSTRNSQKKLISEEEVNK